MIDLQMIGTLLSIGVALSSLALFFKHRRDRSMEEGIRCEKMDAMIRDLDRAHEKIRSIELRVSDRDGDFRELRSDITYIKDAIQKLEKLLMNHVIEGVPS